MCGHISNYHKEYGHIYSGFFFSRQKMKFCKGNALSLNKVAKVVFLAYMALLFGL